MDVCSCAAARTVIFLPSSSVSLRYRTTQAMFSRVPFNDSDEKEYVVHERMIACCRFVGHPTDDHTTPSVVVQSNHILFAVRLPVRYSQSVRVPATCTVGCGSRKDSVDQK